MVDFPRDFPVAVRRLIELRIAMRILQELTKVRELSAIDKTIYTVTMLQQPPSIHALSAAAGLHKRTVAEHCAHLEHLGWLQLTKEGFRRQPDAVLPADVEAALAEETRRLMRLASFHGEEDAKRFVDWIVAPTVQLVYNARPSFLENRKTKQKMEYDVFAPDYAWALEHQGDQHFAPTSQYPSEHDFVELHKRDLQKVDLSKKHKIRFSAISCKDLTIERMQAAIPADIPRRAFDPRGPYAQMLERVGKEVAGVQADLT